VVVVSLLLGALLGVLLLGPGGGFKLILAPFAVSSSNSSSSSDSSSSSNSSSPAASPSPAGSPAGSGSPTQTPVPPTLDVHPTSIQFTACVSAQANFTVANTGGASFSWTATSNVSGYSITPSSGTIDAGKQDMVTVSGILLGGKVTITAPNARNSPQQVTITCTV